MTNDLYKLKTVSGEIKNRVESKVLECVGKAQARFGAEKVSKIPEIRYDTTGKTAGWAYWNNGNPYIDINPILLNENVEHVINQTVPHEVAHIVVNEIWQPKVVVDRYTNRQNRTIRPHGMEWSHVMRVFGIEPDRCHCIDTTTIDVMKGRVKYPYKCICCGREFHLSSIRHKRAMSFGTTKYYQCVKCKARLVYVNPELTNVSPVI